jgi:hypothetical protein
VAIQTKDGSYVMANYTAGGIGGDKTQSSWGLRDYWIIKFCQVPIINFTAITQNICPGSCIDFLNHSINANNFLWYFPGATPGSSTNPNPTNICYSNPGNYDVFLNGGNSCGSNFLHYYYYITVYPSPPPQSITQSGDTLFAISGSASYQWYFNTNIISGATNYFYVAPSSGDYNVVATDTNGCEVEAAVFNVVAGLQSTVDGRQLTIFPNPVEDEFRMFNQGFTMETAVEVSIYNVLGEKMSLAVDGLPIAIGMLTVDCRPLFPGVYYVEITAGEKTFRGKFIKQ